MKQSSDLAEAIAHLRAFRATFNAGDEVDEESHLTAAALDTVLAAAECQQRADQAEASDLASGGSLDADDLGNMA